MIPLGTLGSSFYVNPVSGFSPTLLSGKQFWLRGKDHSIGAAATLLDNSGQLNNATGSGGTVTAGATPSGGKAFIGTNMHYTLPTTVLRSGTLIASASSVFGSNFASNAVDGNTGNLWASATNTGWLQVRRTGSPAAATSYAITTSSGGPNQYPKTWTFEGSLDGSIWTTLDTRTNIVFSPGVKQTFTFTNPTAYLFYRLNITANNGDALVALAELELDGQDNNATSIPDGEMWIVVKTDGGSGPKSWQFGTGTQSHYTYGGQVYDNFGSNSRFNFTPSVNASQWRLYRVRASGTSWSAWLDNTLQLSTTSTKSWAGTILAVDTFSGGIAEMLVLSQPATSGEAAGLITYFNTEHGLSVPGGA